MNKIKALAFVFVISTLATLALAAAQDNPVSGTWNVSGDVVGNALRQVCTFTQEGKNLKGTCKVDGTDKPTDVLGSVEDKTVKWSVKSEYNGEPLTIVFSGTLKDAEISGSIDVQPFSVSGEFTAKKEAPKK